MTSVSFILHVMSSCHVRFFLIAKEKVLGEKMMLDFTFEQYNPRILQFDINSFLKQLFCSSKSVELK